MILIKVPDFCKFLQSNNSSNDFEQREADNHNADYFSSEKRGNFVRYKFFYNIFVRQIVGKKEFDNICRDWSEGDAESKIATVSDEALALLCFENQIDVWKDVWEKSKGQIRAISKSEEYPQDWISTKTTKYTTKYDSKGMAIDSKDKTWTIKGIERFNELFREVQKDRIQHPDFIEEFIDWKQSSSKKSSGSVASSKDSLPDANDDLFHDPDDLNRISYTPVSKNNDNDDSSSDENSEKSEEDDSDDNEEDAESVEEKNNKKPKSKVGKRQLKMG